VKASLRTTKTRLDRLKTLVRKRHRWPASFSLGAYDQIWPFESWGHTKPDKRENVRGKSKLLDAIAYRYRIERPEGGRFFLDDEHAYKPVGSRKVPFLRFKFAKQLRRQGLD